MQNSPRQFEDVAVVQQDQSRQDNSAVGSSNSGLQEALPISGGILTGFSCCWHCLCIFSKWKGILHSDNLVCVYAIFFTERSANQTYCLPGACSISFKTCTVHTAQHILNQKDPNTGNWSSMCGIMVTYFKNVCFLQEKQKQNHHHTTPQKHWDFGKK